MFLVDITTANSTPRVITADKATLQNITLREPLIFTTRTHALAGAQAMKTEIYTGQLCYQRKNIKTTMNTRPDITHWGYDPNNQCSLVFVDLVRRDIYFVPALHLQKLGAKRVAIQGVRKQPQLLILNNAKIDTKHNRKAVSIGYPGAASFELYLDTGASNQPHTILEIFPSAGEQLTLIS